MPDTPLNPDAHALRKAVEAVHNETYGAHGDLAHIAVNSYVYALAQSELQANSKPNQNLEFVTSVEVTSVEELDALPIGTVVYANNHIGPAERFDVGWMGCGNTAAWSSPVLARDGLPARVLYRPTKEASNGRE